MYTLLEQKKGSNSTVDLSVTITEEELTLQRPEALKRIGEHAELPGFRKGHIPENILVSKIGEQAILEEMAELAIGENYADIVMQSKIHPVAHPQITITKIAKGNQLEFSMVIEVKPEFSLPDYKVIAKKNNKKEMVVVTEEDVEEVVNEIKKHNSKDGDSEKVITDEFVKTIGNFDSVADFKAKITENLKREKEMRAKQKNRLDILNAISAKTDIEIPNSYVERELDQMISEFSHELSRSGQTFENYKLHAKKTEEEIREVWKEQARKRVVQDFLLQKIGEAEGITADKMEVEKEAAVLQGHHPDAPKESIFSFIEDMLTKQEVFKFLENQS